MTTHTLTADRMTRHSRPPRPRRRDVANDEFAAFTGRIIRAHARRVVRGDVEALRDIDRPYRHAAHYTGWAANLDQRLAEHASGRGARLLAVAQQAGIGCSLARTWPGTRSRERALNNRGGASRRCPICRRAAHTRAHTRSRFGSRRGGA